MREILIATGNEGKFKEIMEVLSSLPFKFHFLKELGLSSDGFVENGETFEENAHKKAKFFAQKSGMITVGEDSGIIVDAIPGELGVYTRRWGAGENASDEEWIEFFMKRMEGEKNRKARFVCCSCVVGEGIEEFFNGITEGQITETLMAPIAVGLPLSSCFVPDGFERVYSAMSHDEKNAVSHRGKSIHQLKDFLLSKA